MKHPKRKKPEEYGIWNCFGNFCEGRCNQKRFSKEGCKREVECMEHVNTTQGPCNCKYKRLCHVPRQTLQHKFRTEPEYKDCGERTIEDCWFYKEFVKDEQGRPDILDILGGP